MPLVAGFGDAIVPNNRKVPRVKAGRDFFAARQAAAMVSNGTMGTLAAVTFFS